MGLQLILTTALVAATPAACSWAHPGANPYRGDPVRALDDFALPDETRRQLRALMREHRYTDVATITRDDIAGEHAYADLRDMHSGRGQVCRGSVDRSAWSATHRERGLVYCVGETCVLVPTVCNNVSLVTRQAPVALGAGDDEPIDIEPAAGPPPAPAAEPAELPPDLDPLAFLPPTQAGPGTDTPGGGDGGGTPVGPGGPADVPPGGNDTPCCSGGPGGPGSAGNPGGPIGPIPEPPAGWLLAAGAAWLAWRRR